MSDDPILLSVWRNIILRKLIFILILALFWILVAPLTQLAQAEAPVLEEEIDEIRENLPYFKQYAYDQVKALWGSEQWEYVDFIISKESSWDNTVKNPKSTAFGYGQFLDSTWETVGCVKTTNPNIQIDCMLKYIKQRYNYPQKAYQFWLQNNWY